MPGGVRSELRRRNLLASTGSGRIEEMESLADIRAQIDRLDQEIVALLAERGAYVRQAARFKRTEAEARAPERVEQVIGRVRELAEQWRLEPDVAERVYRAMIGAFVELELAEVMGRRRRTSAAD
jgi:isochorismate pyruvate lyase